MKKKIFLITVMAAMLVCIFAISASAETVLKPQTNNEYGELSFFDESMTVGRVKTDNGFTPYIDAEGTTYARVVVGDGTTFYTFPTSYVLSNTTLYGRDTRSIFIPDLSSLNSAIESVTNKNPSWTNSNIYRIELPVNVRLLNGGGQNFASFEKVIEIYLQPNSQVLDRNKNMTFWHCFELETIHNLDTFVFKNGSTGGAFQDCRKLTNVKLGVSEDVTNLSENMFNGCTALKSVNFIEAFPNVTAIGSASFANTAITSISIPAGFTTIGNYAFLNCKSLKTVEFLGDAGENATLGTGVFENCSVIESLFFPEGVVTLGNSVCKNSGLKHVRFPSTLTELLENSHFLGSSLVSVEGLENTAITNIPHSMFRGQKNWKPDLIALPNTVTTIATYGFADVGMKAISLGAGMTRIDDEAFTGCSSLGNVYVPDGIQEGKIVQGSFNGRGTHFFVTSTDNTYLEYLKPLFGASAIVTYEEYAKAPDNYKSGKYIISGYNKCVAFYDGEHSNSQISPCVFGCSVCLVTTVNHISEFESFDVNYPQGFLFAGEKVGRCSSKGCTFAVTEVLNPLFYCQGYSAPENGNGGIVVGFRVDNAAITEYERVTEKTVSYGIFAVLKDRLKDSDVFVNGEANESAVVGDVTKYATAAFEIKIVGFETDAQKDAKIAMGAYVAVTDNGETEYSYLQNTEKGELANGYYFITFTGIVSPAN